MRLLHKHTKGHDGETIRRIRRRYVSKAQAQWLPSEVEQVIVVRKGEREFASIKLLDEWDQIVFTDQEPVVKQAMRLIEPDFENLTFVRVDNYGAGD